VPELHARPAAVELRQVDFHERLDVRRDRAHPGEGERARRVEARDGARDVAGLELELDLAALASVERHRVRPPLHEPLGRREELEDAFARRGDLHRAHHRGQDGLAHRSSSASAFRAASRPDQ
jgi:hypothetical protein